MSDCPAGCGWKIPAGRWPPATYAPGKSWPPLVWRGALVLPEPGDPINQKEVDAVATATHLVACHPDHAEVRRVFA
jgi:hypothetical protein